MSVEDKSQRLRDPFYSSPLPRTYYYPSPTRDVNNSVAIQGPEKKDQLSKRSSEEDPFEIGSTFKLSALPQLKSVIHQSRMSQGSDELDNIHPRSEQPSNSTLLDTTNLTSSIDEKERSVSMEYEVSRRREEGREQEGAITTIQSYIDRFRYSAPKSREERQKEKATSQNTFWWMRSDAPPIQGLEKSHTKEPSSRPFAEHLQRVSRPESGRKLTREAVLELDKETSDLQRKADKLLSKSQLSLASSGPCVSTDGLGSSTALSECSYITDPQPAYRPIFVNLQGNVGEYRRDPVKPKDKFQTIEEEHPLSPKDALARWRMRRKMGDAQQRSAKTSMAHRPTRNTRDIDVKLEEFRKKLFTQRALVTSEDIQFERQKMKMLIDDEDDKDQNEFKSIKQTEVPQADQPSILPQKDPILSRLREITRTNESPYFGSSLSADLESDKTHPQKAQNNLPDSSVPLSGKGFNSNNANSIKDLSRFEITSDEPPALNRNNTALSLRGFDNQQNENYRVDEMKSMIICDAKQSSFSLSSKDDKVDSRAIGDSGALCDKNRTDSLDNLGDANKMDNLQHVELFSHSDTDNSCGNAERVPDQNTHYHQRLEAEKPCVESNNHRERQRSTNSKKSGTVNSVSSGRSDVKDKSVSREKKMIKKPPNMDDISYSNDEEISDSSSKKSHSSSHKAIRLRHGENQNSTVTRATLSDKDKKSEVLNKSKDYEPPTRPRKDVPAPGQDENIKISVSQSSEHSNIHRVIGETVVDHLFDGPSMISSVDSWASLFPQSPSHSHCLYNSTTVTPTKDSSSNRQSRSRTPSPSQRTPAATPPNKQMLTSTPHSDKRITDPGEVEDSDMAENDERCKDSSDENERDPLMNLLLQQRKEYLHKLELIEMKLQKLDDDESSS